MITLRSKNRREGSLMYYSFIFLKPDAMQKQLTARILERLQAAGITIEIFDYVYVTDDLIDRHYEEAAAKLGEAFRKKARRSFSGKYIIPVIVSSHSQHIIQEIRSLIGATDPTKAQPGTIRADFSRDSIEKAMSENRLCENLIHASDSLEAYLYEAELWFGKETASRYIET